MPRSAMISSEPPRIAPNLTVRQKRSQKRPIPVCVRARPPKIWHASSATMVAVRVVSSLCSAVGPARYAACSAYVIFVIWKVMHSSHACAASTPAAMRASLARMTGLSVSLSPKVSRWCAHLKHSSSIARVPRSTPQQISQRSWLKLYMMQRKPPFSSPSRFSTGTFTPSSVTSAVPALEPYITLICSVVTPSPRSISRSDMPRIPSPPVRTAVTK
mmetsp:Transcript_44547/g.110404  ORF Transcript_44547/g.110404 Transcript_44547/m.110404 type:complete len:216 (+) Transcript_44547:198-845(+)